MTVLELSSLPEFSGCCLPVPEREIKGAYQGDLLSWVMGRAQADNAWITIMSNVNVIAVASLSDVSCVILCEGVILPEDLVKTANDKMINILYTDLTAFGVAERLAGKV